MSRGMQGEKARSRSVPTSRGTRGSSRTSTSRRSLPSRSRTTSGPRPVGATGLRSPPATSCSRTRRGGSSLHSATTTPTRPGSAASARSMRRRSKSSSAPALPSGEISSRSSSRGMHFGGRTSRASGRIGSTIRERAVRSPAARSSSSAGNVASSWRSSGTPATGDRTRRISIASSFATPMTRR